MSSRRSSLPALVACLAAVAAAPAVAGAAEPTAASPKAAAAQRGAPPWAARLNAALVGELQRRRIPGVVVGVRTPRHGSWTTALGTADIARGTPMTTRTHLRIGSVTKTFTGTLILQLAGAGRLSLDDTISRYVPNVPDGDVITLRQLLNMTSGLYSYTEDESFMTEAAVLGRRWTLAELLRIAFAHPPYFAPGRGYHYSNTNTVLLGMVIERVTGEPLRVAMERRIFAPLGLRETELPADGTRMARPYAQGYNYDPAGLNLNRNRSALADWNAGAPDDVTALDTSWGWAAGGAVSTIGDLLDWSTALGTGRTLTPAMKAERERWIPIGEGPNPPGYGLNIANFQGAIGHNGRLPGFNSYALYVPRTKTSIALIANSSQSPDASQPAEEIVRIVRAAVSGRGSGRRG